MIALLNRNQILLLGLCSALLVLLAYEQIVPAPPLNVPAGQWQMPATTSTPNPLPIPPSSRFAAIDTRPVFNPTRKPITAQATPSATSLPPPSDVSLIGIIIEGDHRLALLHVPSAALETSVTVGGEVSGWQVTAIEADHIVLHAGSTDYSITLNSRRGAGEPPAAASPDAGPVPHMPPTTDRSPPARAPPTADSPPAPNGDP